MANKRRRLLLETSSRCVTPFTQAAHTFEVSSFSLLDGAMGAGEFVSSSTFSAGGRDWNIRVYPDGTKKKEDDDEPGAWVSAFLRLLSGDATRTRFTIDVMEKDGTPWRASELISPAFEEAGDGWGCRRLVKKSSSLRSMLHRNDDCLMIRCELTVLGESHSEDVVGGGGGAMASPEPNLHGQLGRLLECGKGADVAFDVDGRVFHAHRCVLAARSPVFEAELFGAMKEKDMDVMEPIKVHDMEPAIFEELLHFVYTDSMSSAPSSSDFEGGGGVMVMPRLLVAADRYGLDRLRLMCEVKLCRGIDAKTVADTLALAERHHCARLKDACLGFIASRDANVLGVVMKTDGFKHLVARCPSVAVDILDKIAHG